MHFNEFVNVDSWRQSNVNDLRKHVHKSNFHNIQYLQFSITFLLWKFGNLPIFKPRCSCLMLNKKPRCVYGSIKNQDVHGLGHTLSYI
jgi:hypothetical protein